jgi:hypothetical protein
MNAVRDVDVLVVRSQLVELRSSLDVCIWHRDRADARVAECRDRACRNIRNRQDGIVVDRDHNVAA